jgi:hypothetical protein
MTSGSTFMRRPFTVFLMTFMMLAAGAASAASQNSGKTVWDGVFTAQQAERGKQAFAANCSTCHGPDLQGGNASSLKGDVFMLHWSEDNLNAVFARVKTMPPRAPVPLTEAVHLDILAHILSVNEFPPGNEELEAASLGEIKVESKDGPGAVPNGALVEAAGCLTAEAGGGWTLTRATDLVRTREPNQPAATELLTSAAPGTQTYRLLYPESFSPGFRIDAHKGHKMQARGFLIRTANDLRINVTWLEMLADTCGQ